MTAQSPIKKKRGRPVTGVKPDGCRQLRVECPTCGYLARVTRKWLTTGALICPTDGARLAERKDV